MITSEKRPTMRKKPQASIKKGPKTMSLRSRIFNITVAVLTLVSVSSADHFVAYADAGYPLEAFTLTGDFSMVADTQTGIGTIKNGMIGDYPEGSCIPAVVKVTNDDTAPMTETISIGYDYSQDGIIGIQSFEELSTAIELSSITNLNQFNYSEAQLETVTSFPTTSGASVVAAVTGLTDTGISGGVQQKQYDITLTDIPGGETVLVWFCVRLGDDASSWNGAKMSLGMTSGGTQNIGISTNAIRTLPELTLTKTVVGGTAVELNIPTTFDPGTYSITESGPSNYTPTYSTECEGGIITLAYDDAPITCAITNTYTDVTPTTGTIELTAEIINDDAGTITDPSVFTYQVGTGLMLLNDPEMFTIGDYSTTISGADGYTYTFSGNCDSVGNMTLAGGQNLVCHITFNDEPAIILPGALTVIKVVDNVLSGQAVAEEDFELYITNTSTGSKDHVETNNKNSSIIPGTYAVSEEAADGLDPLFDQYTASFSGDCDASGLVTVGSEENKVCTITNTYKQPTLTTLVSFEDLDGVITSADPYDVVIDKVSYKSGVAIPVLSDVTGYLVAVADPGKEYDTTFSGDCDATGVVSSLSAGDAATCNILFAPASGTITVTKIVEGSEASIGSFVLYLDDVSVVSGSITEVEPGLHEISEGPHDGYTSSISGDEACEVDGTVTVGPGEDIACTITNTFIDPEDAVLTVDLEVVGGSATVEQLADLVSFTDGNKDWIVEYDLEEFVLTPGEFTLTPGTFAGYTWEISGEACTTGTVDLDAGESQTCTVTYTSTNGTLLVHIYFQDSLGVNTIADPFYYTVDKLMPIYSGTAYEIAPGAHVISQEPQAGYSISYGDDCAGEEAGAMVTVPEQGAAVCSIYNIPDQEPATGSVTVTKVVVGGTATVEDFTLYAGDNAVVSGTTNTFPVGTYSIHESADDGISLSDYSVTFTGDCDSDGDLTLTEDASLTCTITNTYITYSSGGNSGGGGGGGTPTTTLTAHLVIVNDDGHAFTSGDFDVMVGTDYINLDSTYTWTPGTYIVKEIYDGVEGNNGDLAAAAVADGYTMTCSGDCSADGTVNVFQGDDAVITITINDIAAASTTDTTTDTGTGSDTGTPAGQVLGESDEDTSGTDTATDEPAGEVLGATDEELPRTGVPMELLGLLGMFTMFGLLKCQKKS
ncbi:MAG: hypothetical protein WC730_04025 [Patescibacteria group bacterium]|jgi:hypothetical protein